MSAREARPYDPEENRRAPRPASSHPQIAERLASIEEHWPGLPQAPAMPKRLSRTVDEFGSRPENQDGRGLTVAARGTVVRTLGHVESAVRRSDGQGSLGHKARGFLKSLVHIDDFDETAERGRRFFGEILKAGRRRASATPVCEAQAHVCGEMSGVGEIRLCREVSVAGLRQVGRELGLCVAHANEVGRPYHTELKKGESEFWSLRTPAGSFALLSVRIEEGARCVAEFEGRNGKRPVVTDEIGRRIKLSGALLRNVLRKLKADASDIDHFTRVGAFPSLLRGNRANYRDVCVDGRNFRIWRFANEVIIASSRRSPRVVVPGRSAQWSRFVRRERRRLDRTRGRRPQSQRRTEWEQGAWHNTAMDLGELLELLRQSPDLYDTFVGTEGVDESK